MNPLHSPLGLVAVVCVIFVVAAVICALSIKSTKIRIGLAFLTSAFLIPPALYVLVFYPWLIDARYREYRSFYNDLKIGMTREQVMEVAKQHYPEGGTRGFPKVANDDETNLGFFMNPEGDREPNCEGILLCFKDGKVVDIDYSAD